MTKTILCMALAAMIAVAGCEDVEPDHDVAYYVNGEDKVVEDAQCDDAAMVTPRPVYPIWLFFPRTVAPLSVGDTVPPGGLRGARPGMPSARASTRPAARPVSGGGARPVSRPMPVRPPIVIPRGGGK